MSQPLSPLSPVERCLQFRLPKVNSWTVQLLWHFYFARAVCGRRPKVNLWCRVPLKWEDGDGVFFLVEDNHRPVLDKV